MSKFSGTLLNEYNDSVKDYMVLDRVNEKMDEGFIGRLIGKLESLDSIVIDLLSNTDKRILIDLILSEFKKELCRAEIPMLKSHVCEFFGYDEDIVFSEYRKQEYVFARQLCMFVIKNVGFPYAFAGHACGGKDHATALHACKTIINYLETDPEKRRQIKDFVNSITYLDTDEVKKAIKQARPI